MKRVALAGFALFTAMILPLAAQETNPAPAPVAAPEPAAKIVCEAPTFNFGEMDNSQDVEHTFIVRNNGNLTLEITRVKPSCGCTVVNTSQTSVPPGQTTEIKARLSLRGRLGPQHKTIFVECNDPATPTMTLLLEGTAISELQVTPTQVFFGRITADTAVTGVVDVVIQGTNAIKITKLEANIPQLSVTNRLADDGKSFKLFIVTTPPLARGTLRGNVHLETDHPKYPAIDISASAFVVGEVSYAPEEIPLNAPADQAVMRYIMIRAESGQSLTVNSVEAPDPTIAARVIQMDPSGVRIELSNITASKELDGKPIRILTNMEKMKEILIPFRVTSAP